MKCYVHNEIDAVGTCVNCGKFICETCNTEIHGKNYCKKCVSEVFDSMKKESESKKEAPMVFMNAGGGGGGSSSSSSSSSSFGSHDYRRGPYHQSCLLHIVLFFFTAGIGNIIYYLWAKSRY